MNSLTPVASLAVSDRSEFIWKCYAHVVGAILAFAAIETYLFQSGVAQAIASPMMQSPMLVLMAFIALSWGAGHLAHRLESKAAQYAAFGAFVVVWSIMFVPMLAIAMVKSAAAGSSIIESAASVTIFGCVALIATAMITRKDFSFLRGILVWGFFIALGLIGASFLFGWNLGTWFSVGMIGFAGVAVLYDTSNIMHHYPQDKYVAASMALFASIAMMFWYVLRLFISRD
ncbi:MAG: Bax inhibitor-1 family protein [Gammaproteobacteria bacterium]|nr:Bax inhibitor-1 family protein [Gammaproteobacteria bacterium]MBT8111024.1 Bax inhibitor-1 family protein [Gammaproteobacteria bacterium]NND48460.1 permease [Woeseiaceae bacterium]NNL45722.1 permease [Woeseiaceae bacterium]